MKQWADKLGNQSVSTSGRRCQYCCLKTPLIHGLKILRVNLTTGAVAGDGHGLTQACIGSRGLGSNTWSEATVDPLSPENKIIEPEPLNMASTGGTVITKVPRRVRCLLNSGGYWGAELKMAGAGTWVILEARAQPVYLYINDVWPSWARTSLGQKRVETGNTLAAGTADPLSSIVVVVRGLQPWSMIHRCGGAARV
jgi:aldehyde:ferredoxin oxidoreductase